MKPLYTYIKNTQPVQIIHAILKLLGEQKRLHFNIDAANTRKRKEKPVHGDYVKIGLHFIKTIPLSFAQQCRVASVATDQLYLRGGGQHIHQTLQLHTGRGSVKNFISTKHAKYFRQRKTLHIHVGDSRSNISISSKVSKLC